MANKNSQRINKAARSKNFASKDATGRHGAKRNDSDISKAQAESIKKTR